MKRVETRSLPEDVWKLLQPKEDGTAGPTLAKIGGIPGRPVHAFTGADPWPVAFFGGGSGGPGPALVASEVEDESSTAVYVSLLGVQVPADLVFLGVVYSGMTAVAVWRDDNDEQPLS